MADRGGRRLRRPWRRATRRGRLERSEVLKKCQYYDHLHKIEIAVFKTLSQQPVWKWFPNFMNSQEKKLDLSSLTCQASFPLKNMLRFDHHLSQNLWNHAIQHQNSEKSEQIISWICGSQKQKKLPPPTKFDELGLNFVRMVQKLREIKICWNVTEIIK